ncbi:hypothetical protein PPOP_3085, partial [Paenibacillus popilliae ATCC 14706]
FDRRKSARNQVGILMGAHTMADDFSIKQID